MYRDIGLVYFIQLAVGSMRVNQCLRGVGTVKQFIATGDHLAKANTNGQNHIRLSDRITHMSGHTYTRITDVTRIVVIA